MNDKIVDNKTMNMIAPSTEDLYCRLTLANGNFTKNLLVKKIKNQIIKSMKSSFIK
jgi:hypothetical protein